MIYKLVTEELIYSEDELKQRLIELTKKRRGFDYNIYNRKNENINESQSIQEMVIEIISTMDE